MRLPAAATPVTLLVAATLLTGQLAARPAAAEQAAPTLLGRTHYTGELHSHTSISDGQQLPADAFRHVATRTDADFFALTEHDVLLDQRNSDDFTTDWREAASQEWAYLNQQAAAYNADAALRASHRPDGDPLETLAGVETTWYDGSGHINVFNTDWYATARPTVVGPSFDVPPGDAKYDLPAFYARLKQDRGAVAQLNHPDPAGKGNFFDYRHLDPAVDARVDLIEVKNEVHLQQFQQALDAGWHLAPTFNGDEHQPRWVGSREAVTGIWARERSETGLYQAMRERSVYSTQDADTVLELSGNGRLMGSVLPGDTRRLDLEVDLRDADAEESFVSVEVVSNDGAVVHRADVGEGSRVAFSHQLDVADGDFYYVVARQQDGQPVVSAPLWIGERTRGADYAPQITPTTTTPSRAALGDRIPLPALSATDDSGEQPTTSVEVWDDAGRVPVRDGAFTIRGYSDHVVVVRAEDAAGNVGAELLRVQVDAAELDPEVVFSQLGGTATVGPRPGTVGLNVSTEATVGAAYAQLRPVGSGNWESLPVLAPEATTRYEINTVDRPGGAYVDTITGQPLNSHDFTSPALRPGRAYEYRFGVTSGGNAPDPDDPAAWTDVRGTVTVPGPQAYGASLHLLGSISADTSPDYRDATELLRTSRRQHPGPGVVVQSGDLVSHGVRREQWEAARRGFLDSLELPLAPVVGGGETLADRDHVLEPRTNQAFTSQYALPDGAPNGESSYSFGLGTAHVAVLNTERDLTDQLDWLAEDLRAARPRGPVVVVGHASYYGSDTDPAEARERAEVAAALADLGVDLYVGGESGVYQRTTVLDGAPVPDPGPQSAGVTFLSLGTAGATPGTHRPQQTDDVVRAGEGPLVSVLEPTRAGLGLTTRRADGSVVDQALLG